MNKTPAAQQAKTSTFLPPAQGLLQRKCACGNHTLTGGECTDCAKKTNGLQRKLTIGASHDPLEQEADRIADQVLAAPMHFSVSNASPRIQRYVGQASEGSDTAPPSVGRVLANPGRPLEPALRQDMEQRFGHDFSQVRVHSGAAAEQSARAVRARAYTVGHDVVFGAGALAPQTSEGRHLIVHELAHVVQQTAAGAHSGSSLLQRKPAPEGSPGEKRGMDESQGTGDYDFSDDPRTKGGFGEKDPTIRVKPGPVRTTLIRPQRMTSIDGHTYFDINGKQFDPGAWTQSFLSFFDFWTAPSLGAEPRYVFRRARRQPLMTLTQVIDTLVQQGAIDGLTIDRTEAMRAISVKLPPPPPGPSKSRVSLYLSFSVVRTGHKVIKPGRSQGPDPTGAQAAFQVTWELHKEDKSGPELSWVSQVAAFKGPPPGALGTGGDPSKDSFRLQSIYSGFQAAWVFSFLNDTLQLSPLVQALAGVALAEQTADGIIKMVPTGQVAAGVQVVYVYEIPGTDKQLQIGGQNAVAFTAPKGAYATVDFAPGIFLQWKLN